MIKKIIVSLILLLGFSSVAQEATSSPYSFYGLGLSRDKGTIENRAMGGLSVLADSIHLNFQNPAFYSNIKLTTFTVAGNYNMTSLKSANDEERARRVTLDYLAVGLPMGKVSAGFGLMPFTSVGYKITRRSTDTDPVERRYFGTGGINKVFAGAAYEISPKFSVGAEFNYYFGKIETTSLYRNPAVQLGTREMNYSSASGIGFNFGANYKTTIKGKYDFMASATLSPGNDVSLSNERSIGTVAFFTNGSYTVTDNEAIEVPDTEVKVPMRYSFGAGFGQQRKWMVGTELTFQQSGKQKNRLADISGSTFEDAIKWSVGGYYIPDYNSFTSYFKKIVYRAGLRYETTGLVINGESITDVGANIGLGLPLTGTFSNINISAEFGKRGTTNAGLVQENYTNIGISLSLNDRWFVKRKYD